MCMKMRQRMLKLAQVLEIVMAALILAAVLAGGAVLVYSSAQELAENAAAFAVGGFLERAFLIIMGIELVKMLMLHTYGAVIDVLMFAIARQMIVSHDGPWGTLLGVVALAGIFAIKKFLYTGESWGQKREPEQ